MFNWFRNLKIRQKLIGTFLALIGSFVFISVLVQINQNYVQSAALTRLHIEQKIADLSLQSQNALLMARRAEKDYLLRYKRFGFDKARQIYVNKVQYFVALIHNYMTEIRELEEHESIISLTKTADQIIDEYENTFLTVVDLFEKRGFKDSGMEGKFREKIHAIEKAVKAKKLDQLTILMLTMRRHEKDFLLRNDPKYIDRLHKIAGEFKITVNATNLSEEEKDNLITLLEHYQLQFDEFVEVNKQITVSIDNYRAATHTLEPWFEEIHTESIKRVQVAQHEAEIVAKETVWIISIIGILLILISIWAAIFIANFINKPLALIVQGAKSLTIGDIALMKIDYVELERLSTHRNEIGDISRAFMSVSLYFSEMISDIVEVSEGLAEGKALIMPKTEYQGSFIKIKTALEKAVINLSSAISKNMRQDWLKTGQMQLNQLMSGEQEMETLAKNIIAFLVPYIEAKMGLFYLLYPADRDNDTTYLKSIADYACEVSARAPTTFKVGDGLVGQAALDKKIIERTYKPQEYKQIVQSGLTRTIPRHIYFLPFLHEDTVKGVIEIGSFNEWTEAQREFLEQVMPSIAVAVNTTESRDKMQILFQQMQMQSEELLEQKEELRQTNEQLESRALDLENK